MPTILFSGGGTMGPVTPLLAVLRQMKKRRPNLHFVWVGTPGGPERAVIEKEEIPFYDITVAKLPRYISLEWLAWPFHYLSALWQAKALIQKIDPALVASVGGFTSVPLIRAAAGRRIPCVIHQLDAEPGLSNKAVAKKCQSVTTSFTYDISPFSGVSNEQVPTPSRFASAILPSRNAAADLFGLDPQKPIVFVIGGGTGAKALNEAIWNILETFLSSAQIIHLTGAGKDAGHLSFQGYVMAEFFDEEKMRHAYACADLVIARAGMGTLAELAALSKPTILVPIPESHQELNVKRVPVHVVPQGQNFSTRLLREMRHLLENPERLKEMGEQLHAALPTDDGSALAEKWLSILKS